MMTSAPAEERGPALAAVKVQINKSARYVGQQAIQLHGGIGMTEEYAVGHYFKRLTMLEAQFGDTEHHLAKLAAAGGLIAVG
jgi:alkylation response protein AidB-like acyl-CoA dehydrogenase